MDDNILNRVWSLDLDYPRFVGIIPVARAVYMPTKLSDKLW